MKGEGKGKGEKKGGEETEEGERFILQSRT